MLYSCTHMATVGVIGRVKYADFIVLTIIIVAARTNVREYEHESGK